MPRIRHIPDDDRCFIRFANTTTIRTVKFKRKCKYCDNYTEKGLICDDCRKNYHI